MMDHYTYRQRLAVQRLGVSADICISDILARSMLFFNEFKVTEMLAQEDAKYLDLALSSPTHAEFTRSAKRVVHRTLPHWCREYFVAERVPHGLKMAQLYYSIKFNATTLRQGYDDTLRVFKVAVFNVFERKLLNKISEKKAEQKIRNLRKYLRCYRCFSIDRFEFMFPDILKLCLDPPIQSELTVDVLKTFCDSLSRQMSVISYVPNEQCLETLILHAKKMRFNFWGLWIGSVDQVFNREVLPYLRTLKNEPGFHAILLKYGFRYNIGQPQYRFTYLTLHALVYEDRIVVDTLRVFAEAPVERRSRTLLLIHAFKTFGFFRNAEHPKEMFDILKILIRSLPLPYVTPTELYHTMEEAVIPEFKSELRRIVFTYSTADIFEDDISVLKPRRLMHLCRVAVRKALANNFMLPDGIQELKLPQKIKDYLELMS